MPIKSVLVDTENGHALSTDKAGDFNYILVTTGPFDLNARFTAVVRTTAGTTIITQPPASGHLVVHDIIISSKKSNATNVQIILTDGTNAITIVDMDNTSGIQLSINFSGIIHGWKDARLELTTDGTFSCTVSTVYTKIRDSHTYPKWAELQ